MLNFLYKEELTLKMYTDRKLILLALFIHTFKILDMSLAVLTLLVKYSAFVTYKSKVEDLSRCKSR